MPPYIKVDKLIKTFGKNNVLKNVSFDIDNKDIFGIIGVSGSGKTTILNILIGFLKHDSGAVLFQSKDISSDRRNIKGIFGFATQGGSFYSKLSVMENLEYFGRLYDIHPDEIKKRSDTLIELMELDKARDTLAGHLSTGMQRRLDIACALIHDPDVLILDEPTEDLDPVLRKEILGLIRRINDQGTTIIITSHLLSEMESVCNKITILHNGEILETGTPDQLKDAYSKYEEIHLETSPGNYDKIIRRLNKSHVKHVIKKSHKVVIYTNQAQKLLKQLLRTLDSTKERLVDIDVNKPSLEEVFESLTRKRGQE
nr:ABC transporter ATP-binding protein [Candidatus Woesearchaeota archaeon]